MEELWWETVYSFNEEQLPTDEVQESLNSLGLNWSAFVVVVLLLLGCCGELNILITAKSSEFIVKVNVQLSDKLIQVQGLRQPHSTSKKISN